MPNQIATSSGQFDIIPGVSCDVYIANNGEALMSERGLAKILGMKQASLQNMVINGFPKTIKPFINKYLSIANKSIKVTAKNSHFKGIGVVK